MAPARQPGRNPYSWAAIGAFVIISGVLLLVHGPDTTGKAVSTIAIALADTFATLMAVLAVPRLRGRQKIAWACIAAALGANMVATWGSVILLDVIGQKSSYDQHTLLNYLVNYVPATAIPFAILGTAALISTYVRQNKVRTFLGALVVSISVYMIAWVAFLHTLWAGAHNQDASLFIQPMSDVAYAVIIVFMLIRARSADRFPLMLFLIGEVWSAIGDSVQGALLSISNSAYQTGNLIDLTWIVGAPFIAMASVAVRPVEAVVGDSLDEDDALLTSVLPYVAVVLAAAAAAYAELFRSTKLDPFLAWAGIAVMVVLSSRQFLALLENRRLADGLRMRSIELEHNQEEFTALLNHSSDVMMVLDEKGVIQVVRGAVDRVLGREPEELIKHPLVTFVHSNDRELLEAKLAQLIHNNDPLISFTFRILERTGNWRSLEAVASNLLSLPSVKGIILNTRDVTERTELEDQLRHQAFHDPLTGLANRALLRDRLEHAIARNLRANHPIKLVLIDLDDFKTVNDSLGHAAGDELLRVVAERLLECLRSADTAARLGGDEFAVLLEDGGNDTTTDGIVRRLMRGIERPISLGDSRLVVRASVGVATAEVGASAEDILRRADVAMYQAKSRGKGQIASFDVSMEHLATERLRLHAELTRALERDEFFLHYQPIVEMATGALVGVEALVRWQHPERGLIPPLEFIPAAEETGMIVGLSRYVFAEAFAQAHAWHQAHPGHAGLAMSVNVSARHLQTEGFMHDIEAALDRTGLNPHTLILELTEGALLADLHYAINRLTAIRETGIRVALDDFGTGYSSLGYLRDLPVDIIKIDRSFIIDLGVKPEQTELVRAIQTMGRSLRLETVAEGVEDEHQVELLRSLNVERAQGYFYSRPVTAETISSLLAAGPGRSIREVGMPPAPTRARAG